MNNDQNQSPPPASLKIHFFYIVLILAAIIIYLATREWTNLPGFTNYLSVAATLVSLVLAVLAIIYAFVSNGAMSQILGSIASSASSMRDVSGELRSAVDETKKTQGRAETRTDELHGLIGNLRSALDALSVTTAEIAGSVKALPKQLHDEFRQQLASTESSSSGPSVLEKIWTEERVKTFLSRSSVVGLILMKALADATERKAYCDLKKLFDTSEHKYHEYAHGFMIASVSAGIIDVVFYKKGGEEFNYIARLQVLDPKWRDAIQAEWEARGNSSDEKKYGTISSFGPRVAECISPTPVVPA